MKSSVLADAVAVRWTHARSSRSNAAVADLLPQRVQDERAAVVALDS